MMAEPGVSEVIEAFRKELARLDGEPASARNPAPEAVRAAAQGLSPVG